jgi:protocatechuate 3,4-dioxygenase beta subunit
LRQKAGLKMQNDDDTVGHILSRREALILLGAIGAGGGITSLARFAPREALAAVPACIVRPQQTEGPYFVDEKLNRADIRSDPSDQSVRPGVRLDLAFSISKISAGGCIPLANAMVDVWQCDHLGVYSDVNDRGSSTRGKKFLRGYQMTDAQGAAKFITIYPGWYQGRAIHIHFKIRSAPSVSPGFEFTSQLYLPDELSDKVLALDPYSAKPGRPPLNASDGIFRRGGAQLMLNPTQSSDGYSASFEIALQ